MYILIWPAKGLASIIHSSDPSYLHLGTYLLYLQGYSGLRAQDLQEAKDQLLVETSDMLQVPLFTAEALLRNHGKCHPTLVDTMNPILPLSVLYHVALCRVVEWSREMLLEAWMDNAQACCEKCGVIPPNTVASGGCSETNLTVNNKDQAVAAERSPSPAAKPPSPSEIIVGPLYISSE